MILANIIESAFGPLIWVFLQVLLGVHSVIGGSWGWSIIGLTLIVRTLTFPLTRSQFKGMAKMRAHAPELKKIQKRYKDDRQRMGEEQMKYYKANGINPFATCLPLLLQFPVLISLVYMLRSDLFKHICSTAKAVHPELVHEGCKTVVPHFAGWLFVHDVTSKATGVVLIVLIAVYVGTQAFSGAMMSVGNDRNQRLLAIGLPFVFVVAVIQFAAGLLIYWIATNLTMIPQQLYMLRKFGRPNVPITVEAASGARAGPSAGGAKGGGAAPSAPKRGGPQGNGRGSDGEAQEAVKKGPATPPPSARRSRKKRSGRRR